MFDDLEGLPELQGLTDEEREAAVRRAMTASREQIEREEARKRRIMENKRDLEEIERQEAEAAEREAREERIAKAARALMTRHVPTEK